MWKMVRDGIQMFKDFLFNATIIISFLFIVGQMYKSPPKKNLLMHQILFGLLLGSLGILLMVFSISISSKVVADLRHIATLLAALYGGFIPALISAIVIAIGRILLLGFSEPGLIAATNILLVGIVAGCLSYLKWNFWLKGFIINVASMIFVSITFYIIIEDKSVVPTLLLYHWSISLTSGFFIFNIANYIFKSNIARQKVIESEHRYKSLLELSPEGIMVIQNEKIMFINEYGARLFGFKSYTELLGRSIYEFIDPVQIEHAKNNLAYILQEKGRIQDVERNYIRVDGTILEAEYSAAYIEYNLEPSIQLILKDISKRKEAENQLKELNQKLFLLSTVDGLTGVANRRTFDKDLLVEMSKTKQNHRALSLIMFDIDFFKAYNDCYGHQAGDECLKAVAAQIRGLIGEKGLVARYGGEEFAIILPGITTEASTQLAEEVRKAVESLQIEHQQSKVSNVVTISVGVGSYSLIIESPEQMIALADQALYLAKSNGRNRVESN